ncbi:MFS antiporter QDR2 [Cytospora mali]|uniref:MFS antiporter QDR2 n=1 Tax=Cytospora mali TaxID=578113 RepID=A0A194UQF5_CYTMA|nr:MFS antiporter QDR2 [Valsa mali var. pyri (nom. inval.)]
MLSRHFNVSIPAIDLTVTVYAVFQAVSPGSFASLADSFGRRLALNRNSYAVLVALRALQSIGGSATVPISYGIAADVAPSAERGRILGPVMSTCNAVSALGPIIGGAVALGTGESEWVFLSLLVIALTLLVTTGFTLPETSRNVVGNGSKPAHGVWKTWWSVLSLRDKNGLKEKGERGVSAGASRPPWRPSSLLASLRIIFYPDAAAVLLTISVSYCVYYTVQTAIPVIFEGIYGFNSLEVGCALLPVLAGLTVGGIIAGKLLDINYAKTAKADSTAPSFPIERARFRNFWPFIFLEVALVVGFGWAVRYRVHPAVPLILEFFAVGVSTVLSHSASALLVDIFPDASSTAYASGQIARCGLSAASVSVLQPIVVTTFGQPPQYTSVSDPPSPSPGHLRLRVLAVGVPNVARAIAAGNHFISANDPCIPGIDGIGIDDSASPPQKYYFSALPPSPGSLSEHVNVDQKALVPLPDDADEKSVAALVNPAQSSWMAIRHRTSNLPEGWSVAVLGATSASGRVAVRVARALGAGRVIGVARGEKALAEVEGLDERIVLDGEDPARTDFSTLGGQVDVVLDYVYGPAVVALLSSLKPTREVQYVQIGTLGGGDIALPGALLRSKMIALRGSGPGSWTMTQLAGETAAILKAVVDLKADSLHVARLEDVESVWNSPVVKGKRLVFVP